MEGSKVHRGNVSRRKSFIEALREKYCFHEYECQNNFLFKMVFDGRPKNNKTDAELGHLRNVVLSNSCVGHAGLPSDGLVSLCPNLVDLDISGNFLENWKEIFPIILQLPRLKFLNLSRNQLNSTQICCEKSNLWHDCIENLVLNDTGITWREALSLSRCLPGLKELHVCGNGYKELWIEDIKVLDNVECLRLNNNDIQNWGEIWKLRHLPKLTSLILSGNPLRSIFFSQKQSANNLDESYTDDNDNIDIFQDSRKIVQELLTQVQYNQDESHHNANYPDSNETEMINNNSTSDELSIDLSNENFKNNSSEDVEDKECERFLNQILSEACKQLEVLYERRKRMISVGDGCHHSDGESCDITNLNNYCKQKHGHTSTLDAEGDTEDICDLDNVSALPEITSCPKHNSKYLENNIGSSVFATVPIQGDSSVSGDDSRIFDEKNKTGDIHAAEDNLVPFCQLESICMSDTRIAYWQSLEALRQYPCLKSLRIMDVTLWSDLTRKDKRKLLIACLPNISVLNGSEVTVTEREKAERHFLHFFVDKQDRPDRYEELEAKHGILKPLVDIDIRRGFQEWATIHIVCNGKRAVTDIVRVVEPVYKLRQQIGRRLYRYASLKSFTMYHLSCGPHHADATSTFEELRCESLPMSRFDIMEGDEIHISPCDDFDKWPYSHLLITDYL